MNRHRTPAPVSTGRPLTRDQRRVRRLGRRCERVTWREELAFWLVLWHSRGFAGAEGPVSGYRRVRVAENELVHFAGTDLGHTIGCGRAVVAEWVLVSDDRPRCGRCVMDWMAATGQIRLVARLPTALPPELAAPRRPIER